MNKKIMVIGLVVSLVVLLAVPMAVSAESGGTNVTGDLGNTATLIVPGAINLGNFIVGDNTGSATAGSVTANAAGWTLTVVDTKSSTTGYMTIGGTDLPADALTNQIQVGMTAGTVSSISDYQSEIQAATGAGYGAAGTFTIPLFVKQTVVASDGVGSYQITLTYTTTPGI